MDGIERCISAACRGDQAAFAALYDHHAGRVYATCLRMVADPARASDLVQDVFVRAWDGLRRFRGDSSFPTWLHRITINVVLQDRRTEQRRRSRVELFEELDGQPVGHSHDPGVGIDLERALATLPDLLRQVFVLHDVEGYRHQEIAELLEIPIGTSRSHLFRARRKLRKSL